MFVKGTECDKVKKTCSSSSEEESPGTDGNIVSTNNSRPVVTFMDYDHLSNGRKSGGEDYRLPIFENVPFNEEKYPTPFAANEPSSNAMKLDTQSGEDDNLMGSVHEDQSTMESSWFSPIYGMIGKLI